MRKIGKYLLTFIILIIGFVGILLVSCSFPSSLIKENVKSSSKTLIKEGNRKFCFIVNKAQEQMFDNYSDALMINTAYSIDSKTPLYSALTAKKDYVPGVTKTIVVDMVGELNSSSKYDEHDEVSELRDTVNGESTESFEYAKYWHGYLSFLRPLLLIFDYSQIRILLAIIFSILIILITIELAKNKGKTIASLYFLSLFCVEYFYVFLNLMNSVTFLVMMISSLIFVKKHDKIKDFGLFFFIVGMCCSFFGLLDTPLLTLGGPLILYFIYKENRGEKDFRELIKFSILWLLGYSLTWATKWILTDILYHRDLISTAIGQVLFRSFDKNVNKAVAVCLNILYMAIPIILGTIIAVYYSVKYYNKRVKESSKKYRIFYIISLMPIVWYIVLANHSYNHSFFTYRLLFITMLSLLLSTYYSYGEPE